jgi:OmpA-OmpF porin, OOP family
MKQERASMDKTTIPIRPMGLGVLCVGALLIAAACSSAPRAVDGKAAANTSLLAPVERRINDETVMADQKSFNALRARHETLSNKGESANNYALAKAQCWMDVSFHEYSRNDRSAFPELALQEARRLMNGVENGGVDANPTPLLDNSKKLREDLWKRADALKKAPGYSCVLDRVACAEVRLSHAGHEYVQGASFREEGAWRYANPYVRMAEDMIGKAETDAVACLSMPVPLAPAPVLQRTVTVESAEIPVVVVFNFDKSGAADIRPFSREALDRLIARIKNGEIKPTAISVTGHADRKNSTGSGQYNLKLASARAATVAELLRAAGVPGGLIKASSRGDVAQIESCKGKFASLAEERECLLPNRRVEVRVIAARLNN